MEPHFLKAIVSAFHPLPSLVSLIISVQVKAEQVGKEQNTFAIKSRPFSLAFFFNSENEVGSKGASSNPYATILYVGKFENSFVLP